MGFESGEVNIDGTNVAADIQSLKDTLGQNFLFDAIDHGRSVVDMGNEFSDAFNDETGTNTGTTTFTYNGTLDAYETVTEGIDLLLHMDDVGLTDSSANAHPVALSGDVQRSDAQWKFGGYSALFDGSGDYLTVADDPQFDYSGGQTFRMEGWFYFTALSVPYTTLFSKRSSTSNGWVVFASGSVPRIEFRVGGTIYVFNLSAQFNLNEWYHIKLNYDGSLLRVFVNGVSQATPLAIVSITDAPIGVQIGSNRNGAGEFMNGYIDEVLMSNVFDSADNFTPPTAPYTLDAPNVEYNSVVQTVDSDPPYGFVVLMHEAISTVDMNTDFVGEISVDNGVTYAPITFTFKSIYYEDAMVNIYVSEKVDLSAQTGNQLLVRYNTYNGKAQRIHGHYYGVGA